MLRLPRNGSRCSRGRERGRPSRACRVVLQKLLLSARATLVNGLVLSNVNEKYKISERLDRLKIAKKKTFEAKRALRGKLLVGSSSSPFFFFFFSVNVFSDDV